MLLSIGAVSASEDVSKNNLTSGGADILTDPSSEVGTFTDLQGEITSAGSEITLSRNYTYDDATDSGLKLSGITINKALTVNGNGNTIDANQLSRIFVVSSSNVIFKNITFINFKLSGNYNNIGYSDCGGAISTWNVYDNLQILDCTFANGTAVGHGGAVFSRSTNTFH